MCGRSRKQGPRPDHLHPHRRVRPVDGAYEIPYYRISGITAPGQPEFLIDAKVPAGATRDQIKLMFQNLLAEPFKLAAHWEKRARL